MKFNVGDIVKVNGTREDETTIIDGAIGTIIGIEKGQALIKPSNLGIGAYLGRAWWCSLLNMRLIKSKEETNMEYKIGDKVRITMSLKGELWTKNMKRWQGKVMTIRKIVYSFPYQTDFYLMQEDREEKNGQVWGCWFPWMIEGLAYPEGEINIKYKNATVEAFKSEKGIIVDKSFSKCSPDENFDLKKCVDSAIDQLLKEKKEEAIKFDYELFKEGKIAVNCPKEEDAKIFLAYLAGKGHTWPNGELLTNKDWHSFYAEETGYVMGKEDIFLRCGALGLIKEYRPNIIIIPFDKVFNVED